MRRQQRAGSRGAVGTRAVTSAEARSEAFRVAVVEAVLLLRLREIEPQILAGLISDFQHALIAAATEPRTLSDAMCDSLKLHSFEPQAIEQRVADAITKPRSTTI